MLVIQDMVNNGRYNFIRDTALPTIGFKKICDRHMHNKLPQRKAFVESTKNAVRQLHNHPCILIWTIFNEGWGQFNGADMYEELRKLDSSRIIDTASGWFSSVPSNLDSIHVYFKPVKVTSGDKPVLLSEFGGYSFKIPDHSYNTEKTYGYRKYTTMAAFREATQALYWHEILPAIKKGLCGAIYTQLSDVEDETNGFLTYDRRICKVDPTEMEEIAQMLLQVMEKETDEES